MSKFEPIHPETVYSRMANGWDEREATSTPMQSYLHQSKKPVAAQVAREAGVKPTAVQRYMRNGLTLGAAIAKALERQKAKPTS